MYSHFDKKLLIGDFNTEVSGVLSIYLYQHDLENLVKDKTCFKYANNPSTIDLFLNNISLAFQNTTTTTGLSDCHKLLLTVLKTSFSKNKPKELIYRYYKKFNFSDVNDELKRPGRLRGNRGNRGIFIYLFILYSKVEKDQMQLRALKK